MGLIHNGPYLLSPTNHSITIAWTITRKADLQVKYGIDGQNPIIISATLERELPEQTSPNGNYICWACLDNLQSGSNYTYQILHENEILAVGSFNTPAKDSQVIKLLTLGDSHGFNTSELFRQSIKKHQPQLILHSGDISYGTGYERSQYENNWFHLIPEELKTIPVYYVPGNHDDGLYFNRLFMLPQGQRVKKAKIGNSYATNYQNIHFIMIDSNPWGLFEMNAINSGAKVDDHTQNLIDETLRWLEEDLNSPEAQKAQWKILVCHHPYTDTFNHKYLPAMAEKYNIDLVISGHVHYYTKAISINPQWPAKTLFISQGTAQAPAATVNFPTDGRLLEEFPEVVALGENNFGYLEITPHYLKYQLYGYDHHQEKLVDEIIIAKNQTKLQISDVSLKRLDNLGMVEIKATVHNPNLGVEPAYLELIDNGRLEKIKLFGPLDNNYSILLNPQESKKIHTFYQAVGMGLHQISLGDEELEINVYEPNQLTFQHFKVKSGSAKGKVYIIASIEITNNLDRELYTTIPYYINQRMVESKNIFFKPMEQRSVEFIYQVEQRGIYEVAIGNEMGQEIKIEGSITIIPMVQDKSGQGHYGLIHGTPRLITKGNKTSLWLDKYTDYIEIPAQKELLIAKEGFTAMVDAQVNRLANEDEMGHNPLMVRGKSVGWGATYLFRMVLERQGGLKWGICHDITEYSWSGGDVKLKQDSQYALSFDKKQGGYSYVDGQQVAHVTGIRPDENLRQWAQEPIYVGYSYIGHIIPELGHPKYYTHLTAKINEVRFYLQGLSGQDVAAIKDQPTKSIHPSLAIWYDFKDILTVGTHTTKWRHPVIYKQSFKSEKKLWHFNQLRAIARIDLYSQARLIIEVSDNMVNIKDTMEVVLKDGDNYIDLSSLPPAQYIRLRSVLSATINEQGVFVPEIYEYKITAHDSHHFSEFYWSTEGDWQEGEFSGAIRIPPTDRFKQYPEYTDIIHG